ncbi:hypothetical protein DPMN_106800 [Dreissena polymorpha]|uniref:Uncharacterized protein n=1 Tax=Dreissena polymorpha TaxID=45954 RepID=A0A9D4QJD8_DREPO|nr:hypothetical protein DPMN_106800 [Dreissena polymorpha]
MHPIRQGNVSHGTPKGKGSEGGLGTPGAVTWMQMLSRWAKHGGSWRGSPRTEMPGGCWLATYVPDETTGEDETKMVVVIEVSLSFTINLAV